MPEQIRLVVWDLDETFWKGTVTEGGHQYLREHHDLVVELTGRGIINSICSKNDEAQIRAILEAEGLWDYFVFPSINWEPKGLRLAALIEQVQLRPESVLFIDDNAGNRAEAAHYCPGLQVADESVIPALRDDPRLRGKDDRAHSRLRHYQLLERRKSAEAAHVASTGDAVGFLRRSNIRVRLERDVERHIARAVELINRTNQLNFTKRRLPEDPARAEAELRRALSDFRIQAALISVSDDYGDYGHVGFYMTRTNSATSTLIHFCFSCRTLGMGIESWVYQRLGRPALAVQGRVLSDPVAAAPVDWVTEELAPETPAAPTEIVGSSANARGGCVLMPLLHYFSGHSASQVGEFNLVRGGVSIRLDHTQMLRLALEGGLAPEALEAAQALGFVAADFQTRFFEHAGPRPVFIFSNWLDIAVPLYVHKRVGVCLPVNQGAIERNPVPKNQRILRTLEDEWERAPAMGRADIQDNLRMVLRRIPAHGQIFIILRPEANAPAARRAVAQAKVRFNRWLTEVIEEFPNAQAVPIDQFIDERIPGNGDHFSRMTYFRMYQHIAARLGGENAVRRIAAA